MSDVSGENSVVVCQTCRSTQDVDFGKCLRSGWPECCGQTMRLISTTADIGAAVAGVVPLTPREVADLAR